ncbi:sensor histidine kinase [Streptomyces alboflavus]|uniref:sensor histidine kinase n=1 Tax=Streptomyces alboflavus TaxID=67267 RepID=UPI0036A58BCB
MALHAGLLHNLREPGAARAAEEPSPHAPWTEDRPAHGERSLPLFQDERRALSRELHDRVAQLIAAALNSLDLSGHFADTDHPDRARAKHTRAKETLRQALCTTKELAEHLRAPVARTRTEPPRRGAVEAAPRCPVDEAEVFLILREALGNALLHSGAQDITIRLYAASDTVSASIEDNGTGVAPGLREHHTSLGLQSMRERTALLGGSFTMERGPSGGTHVNVTVPMAIR